MQVSPTTRAALLITALAATLGAVYWASRLPVDDAPASPSARVDSERTMLAAPAPEPAPAPSASEQSAAGRRELDLSRLQRRRGAEPTDDLFGQTDFTPAPKRTPKRPIARPVEEVAVAPLPSPPPALPPLPFTYLGRLAEGPDTTVFLAAGDRNLVVKAGDMIDNTYRVDEVGERVILLTYLPHNVKQALAIGGP